MNLAMAFLTLGAAVSLPFIFGFILMMFGIAKITKKVCN